MVCVYRVVCTAGLHLGEGGGAFAPPLPESRLPLEIRAALFLLRGKIEYRTELNTNKEYTLRM